MANARSKFVVEGVEDLLYGMRYARNLSKKSGRTALRKSAGVIRDLARDFAPLDEGYLERSIKVVDANFRDGDFEMDEDSVGVGVDTTMERSDRDGTVGDYAGRMHDEHYNLGEKSAAKQDASGLEVGRLYLERAAQKSKKEINSIIETAIAAAIRRANSRKSSRAR